MTEQLKKALTERFNTLSSKVYCDEQIKDALLKAYLAGGEYGYEIGIDEAKDFMSKCIWGRCADKFHATKEEGGLNTDIEKLTLDIVDNSKPMPPEFSQMVNDNFGDLVD